jgi:cyanophycin synthetase
LKCVINDNAAAENVSVTDQVCTAIVECGRAAANAIGARLAGVDIVTTDLSVPLTDSGGVVLEVNTTPGLYIHCCAGDGHVAELILEACLELGRRPSGLATMAERH